MRSPPYYAPEYNGPPEIPARKVLGAIGFAALKAAIVYGVSAAFPVAGTVIIPIYHMYNYSKVATGLYNVFENMKSGSTPQVRNSIAKVSGSTSEELSSGEAAVIAANLTNGAKESGVLSEMAKQTKVDEGVYAAMLEGSLKSGISHSVGNLTEYAVIGVASV